MKAFNYYSRFFQTYKNKFLKLVRPDEYQAFRENRNDVEITLSIEDFKIDWDVQVALEQRLIQRLYLDFLNSLYVEEVVRKAESELTGRERIGKKLILKLAGEDTGARSFESLLTDDAAWELSISMQDLKEKRNEYKFFMFDELINRLECNRENQSVCPLNVIKFLEKHNLLDEKLKKYIEMNASLEIIEQDYMNYL